MCSSTVLLRFCLMHTKLHALFLYNVAKVWISSHLEGLSAAEWPSERGLSAISSTQPQPNADTFFMILDEFPMKNVR
jgi:hypothetical protein